MNNTNISVKYFLNSGNPLSDEAFNYLLKYHEEDDNLDYKETFNSDNNKEWVGITIDAMAFSNSSSGYILFGVEDKTYRHLGLNDSAKDTLSDVNLILQKLNRYVRPKFNLIRTKLFDENGLTFALMHIPESIGKTHITTSEVAYNRVNPRTGKNKQSIILRKGMIYVRQSGGNREIDPESFENIINKRLILNRESLLKNIVKLVEGPSDSEVYFFNGATDDLKSNPIEISGNTIQLKSEGVDPNILIHDDKTALSLYISQFREDKRNMPDKAILWKFYLNRDNLVLGEKSTKYMTIFCLLSRVPAFYWMKTLNKSVITEIFSKLMMEDNISIFVRVKILHYSAVLGKKYFNGLLKKHKSLRSYPSSSSKKFPKNNVCELFGMSNVENLRRNNINLKVDEFEELIENKLNSYATTFLDGHIDVTDETVALSFDCFLYSKKVTFNIS